MPKIHRTNENNNFLTQHKISFGEEKEKERLCE